LLLEANKNNTATFLPVIVAYHQYNNQLDPSLRNIEQRSYPGTN
jgi:hypothetical protein